MIDPEPIIKNMSAMKTQLGYHAITIDGMIKGLRKEEEENGIIIVRCKDCKFYQKDHMIGWCTHWSRYIQDDVFYCAKGERNTKES